MSEITGGVQTEASAYFCPKCQAPVTRYTRLMGNLSEGNPFDCSACGWSGREHEIVRHNFKHGFTSDEEIADTMARDLRNLLARSAAQTYAVFLLKWGFLDQPITNKQLATYLEAISKAVIGAIVETRKKIVEETHAATGG